MNDVSLPLAALPHDLSPWAMFLGADPVVKTVMVGLALASVLTWTIMLAKAWELRGFRRLTARQAAGLDQGRGLSAAVRDLADQHGVVADLVRAAASEVQLSAALPAEGVKERVVSRLERIEAAAARRLSAGIGILASIGSVGPFVGLFGTVWGIMNAFIGISKAQTTNLAVVAPGIAEALLATALGLVAAIPAVVVYNAFARLFAGARGQVGDCAAEVLRLVSRDLDQRGHGRSQAAE
ncbi:MAG: tonB-system energizer ExbB [Magnetospirillum sp.]